MLDYGPDEETLKNDKKKIAILISIIVFVVILIVLFVIVVILDINRTDEHKKISTTTRRTVSVEESSNDNNEEDSSESNDDEVIPKSDTTTTSTTMKTTNKTSTSSGTKVITSTKIITSTSIKVVEILPPTITHEVANDKSTYPDAIDDWEWAIVNLINETRRKNGLNELLVARDLRQLAEEAADLWLGSGSDVVKEYLQGHSNYRKYTNHEDVTPLSLYGDTVNATKVTTNSALRYLGVGVLYKNDTYYYVIIYE